MQPIKALFLTATFISLLVMSAYSQTPVKNYETNWKTVQGFTDKGLPKSALEEVKKIYELAKKEKQDAQIIKALVYMTNLQTENREDNEVLSVSEIEKEIVTSKEPVTAILNSLLADRYWSYYQQHRYQLYARTTTVNFKKEDIATWTVEDFYKKVSELYLKSLKEEKILQETKLDPFDAIIVKGNMRHLRPTLFDLLAFRALPYFSTDERDIKKPAYAFEIDQASAFDPAADFVTRKFITNDSLSLQHKALLIYQKIIAFHLKDAKPDALIDADIQRIEFVKDKSVHPDKDKLYFTSLNHIANQYGSTPAASQAWYLVAAYYTEKAATYKPYGDSTWRLGKLQAKEICTKVLAQKDSSEGKINCYNLLNTITSHSLQFTVEKVNVPNQPFRSLVKYQNFNTLYLRVIKSTEALEKQLEDTYGERYWPAVVGATTLKSWEQNLPITSDLQEHSTEIKIDGLPAGKYLLIASDNKDFTGKKTTLGARFFYVSGISYVNSGQDYFVLNRDNGQPLAKAAVQVWEQVYDYKTSKYFKQKGKLYQADANGFFRMDKQNEKNNSYSNYSFMLDISANGERFFMNELQSDYYYYNRDEENVSTNTTSTFLFMDRSIYRPGQTIYFKGITLIKNSKETKSKIRTDYSTILFLEDANGTRVDSVKVKTNDYGSFSGKFQLPASGLNGEFNLRTKDDAGATTFRVEEYKRPKFYVDYEPIKGTYKVNDKIKVTGFAKAYAGNNIDGANVKYRVVRQPRFIYSWMFWRWWQPPAQEMEIAHGDVKTSSDGKFTVEFTAIPDLSIEKKFDPVFDYTVYADITDINGETRSGEKMVTVGYKSLLLVTAIPATLSVDSLKTLSIRTQNMNGQFEPANVKVTITKLQEEKRLIRERLWERPDQFIMTKEEYIKNFPYDEYDNEKDSKSWARTNKVFEKTDSVRENTDWKISGGKVEAGFYVIEMVTKDKNGEEVKDIQYIELFDEKSKQLNHPEYLWSNAKKTSIEPGETGVIELGTAAENLFIVQQLDKSKSDNVQKKSIYSFVQLNNEKRGFTFPAVEDDRGGFGVDWIFVKHNRFYQYNQTISVSWMNKDLSIEYATFRDKTLPGSEEKWKLKITGFQKEKVAAEMIASMYDASLDQFYPHSWSEPNIWPSYYNSNNWSGTQNFTSAESQQRYISVENKYVEKTYDGLFDNSVMFIGRGGVMYKRGSGDMMSAQAAMPVEKSMSAPRGVENEAGKKDSDNRGQFVTDEVGLIKGAIVPRSTINAQDAGVQIRKNFNETAFFFPDLKTDSSGSIEFSFTIPEALTKWKFQALAHTKDLSFGYSSKEVVTQKQLMVQPNAPRFLREGDKMDFSTKVVNLTDKELTGQAHLELIDATTNESVDGWFNNMIPNQFFTIAAGQSEAVNFPIQVPYQFNKALVWRITAKAAEFSDGEENAMPVLTNRMLITETMTLPVRGSATKNFTFDKLLNSEKSETLQNYSLTVEYTSNPAWYAIQALPYLMEYPYECAEQTWNRYYANSLASTIAGSSPRIQKIFEQWKIKDTAALLSNLQKNQELKSVLLEETPWVLEAKTENEQKKNIALLFDMIKMSSALNSAYEKLKQMQSSNGGFVWFTGGPDDRYITQYIVTGIGHLRKIKGYVKGQDDKLKQILASALPYLDNKMKQDYDDLIRYKTNLKTYTPGYMEIQYFYMRSFFPDMEVAKASQTAYNYFHSRLAAAWTTQSKYMQGLIALALNRTGDTKTPVAILKSLKETSINNEELGMYWKDQYPGWFWYEAPIERQALLIEAFQEIAKDSKTVDDLRTWLLKNKQTNKWESTKATAEACYALLLQGTDWLSSDPAVTIKLGNTTIRSTDDAQEAGTGYFKKVIAGEKINAAMGNIAVTVDAPKAPLQTSATWGAVYWQYFEDLDKITNASTPLKLVKKLFIEKNTDRGPVLTPINEGDQLKVGDKIKVRVELRVDRDMEYVHMKDMRASALEPVNVLSEYKYQDGLGYYESTKDASTNFFFSYLRKGTYVFEYPLFATHAGNFSNGVTTIQCMYAPEFTSHSEGVRITIK